MNPKRGGMPPKEKNSSRVVRARNGGAEESKKEVEEDIAFK